MDNIIEELLDKDDKKAYTRTKEIVAKPKFDAGVLEMKSNKQIIGLLKAIFFLAISIAMILIGYVISGGETNVVTVGLVYVGIAFFFIGVFMGIANFGSPKDDSKE